MNQQHDVPVITIDGPSGTGKGTICHKLAYHLGWNFLDSGVLYRVLAYAAFKKKIALDDAHPLAALAHALQLHFVVDDNQTSKIFLDNNEIGHEIRSEQCGQNASVVAAIPEVREALLARQRAFAKPPGLVTDGRDMGTVVFPHAILKLFLYASPEERAKRRFLQLQRSGNNVSLAQVVEELTNRDARDTARVHAPLKPASDAVLIDTTDQTIVQVFDNILQLIDSRI